ncbi:hypothetical protein V6N11_007107 [Hibiscus sabdariffa]|uniref:Uncharacterized protein n=1 Tax=Hibiscus sabdariffa TaxID=183260 RepID=A0ABR2RSZ6_9ROSI
MPSSIGAKKPKPSLKTHGPTPGLEQANQNQDPMHPTQLAEPKSNHLNAPTWVTSRKTYGVTGRNESNRATVIVL